MLRVLLILVLSFGVLVPAGSSGWAAPPDAQPAAGSPEAGPAVSRAGSPAGSPAVSPAGVQPLQVCPDSREVFTGFTDVAGSVHLEAISCLVWSGVTHGLLQSRRG